MKYKTQKTDETYSSLAKSEAQKQRREGARCFVTTSSPQRPNFKSELLEEVLNRENLLAALNRVIKNKGSAGIDGMTVDELPEYLKCHWLEIKMALFSGTYIPKPARRVEIPKPNGGVRQLGIPTVLDRFIQQALAQILSRSYDPTFSNSCYGFRPRRSAHQAVRKAQSIQRDGYRVVVDIDLEKFFDRVNHDKLMGKLSKDIEDKRVLRIIRSYLNAGVMENGVVTTSEEGTPQGGPLSPLLSNIILDELDKELEQRGHQFVRYGDDCNIYVKTHRSGERLMKSISSFIEVKLKLIVNQEKSGVRNPDEVKFLGFGFTKDEAKIIIHDKSIKRFKDKVRALTRGPRGVSLKRLVSELRPLFLGWRGYFGICDRQHVFKDLDGWIRRRLRCYIWQQWKTFSNRKRWLLRLGASNQWAIVTAASSRGAWWCSNAKAVNKALSIKYFDRLGVPKLYRK